MRRAYYLDGALYEDVSHTRQIEPGVDTLYIDLHSGLLYYFDDSDSTLKASKIVIPNASATKAGIVRLYTSLGYNEDGTMTQKAITEAIDAITLVVDKEDAESFSLYKPSAN